MILHVPAAFTGTNFAIKLKINDIVLSEWNGYPGKKLLRLPFKLDLTPAGYRVEAEITSAGGNEIQSFHKSDHP